MKWLWVLTVVCESHNCDDVWFQPEATQKSLKSFWVRLNPRFARRLVLEGPFNLITLSHPVSTAWFAWWTVLEVLSHQENMCVFCFVWDCKYTRQRLQHEAVHRHCIRNLIGARFTTAFMSPYVALPYRSRCGTPWTSGAPGSDVLCITKDIGWPQCDVSRSHLGSITQCLASPAPLTPKNSWCPCLFVDIKLQCLTWLKQRLLCTQMGPFAHIYRCFFSYLGLVQTNRPLLEMMDQLTKS